MKKNFFILLTILCLFLLVGCGDKTQSAPKNSTRNTTITNIKTTEIIDNDLEFENYRAHALQSVGKINSDVIGVTFGFNTLVEAKVEDKTYTINLENGKVRFEGDFRYIDFKSYRNFYLSFDTNLSIESSDKDENAALSMFDDSTISCYIYLNDTDTENVYVDYYMNDFLSGIVFGIKDTVESLEEGQELKDISLSALGVAFLLNQEETEGTFDITEYVKTEITDGLTVQSILSLLFSSKSVGSLFTNILSYLKEFKILDNNYHIDFESMIKTIIPIVGNFISVSISEEKINEVISSINDSKDDIDEFLGKFAKDNKYGYKFDDKVVGDEEPTNLSLLAQINLDDNLAFDSIDLGLKVSNNYAQVDASAKLTYDTTLTYKIEE